MWPRRDLIDVLGIEHPIIQAPMAGYATPTLAAAVSNAGALGSLAFGESRPDDVLRAASALRAATRGAFNFNFFTHAAPRSEPSLHARVRAYLAPAYEERGLGAPPASEAGSRPGFDADMLEALLEARPPVVSFHFGLPGSDAIAALREAGSAILCSATTVAEAHALAAAGVDAVIAQGWEAGGHRGAFEPQDEDVGIGTMALVPQVVDAVPVPVIAAGGIADGRGIAAALALGASAVQLGTAFLACPEAHVDAVHRAALRGARDDDTCLSRAFSGRPARAKRNRYTDIMAGFEGRLPDFPRMYVFSEPLMASSVERGDADFQFLLYGQAAALARELPARELVRTLVREATKILGTA